MNNFGGRDLLGIAEFAVEAGTGRDGIGLLLDGVRGLPGGSEPRSPAQTPAEECWPFWAGRGDAAGVRLGEVVGRYGQRAAVGPHRAGRRSSGHEGTC